MWPLIVLVLTPSLFLVAVYLRLAKAISYTGGVPRVGKPGVLGYIQTAFRWVLEGEPVIIEGRKQFNGAPFVIPSLESCKQMVLAGPIFLLPPKYTERLRAGPDSVFNEMMAVNEDLQLFYTMDHHQLSTPYHARVLRTDVNRSLPSYVTDLWEESVIAMDEMFGKGSGDVTSAFDAMTHLVAQISNRLIFGAPLCRDKRFLHTVVQYAETTPLMAPFIGWAPYLLRPFVYFVLSSILGGKKQPLKFIVPHLRKYQQQLDDQKKPWLVFEHIMKNALPNESLERIGIRLLNIEFGSIHTSSIFITQALFEIAIMSKENVDSIREEVEAALESEGGWTKAAVDKFFKIESALREVGRYYGLMHFGLPRFTMMQTDLHDGTFVPPGYKVAVDMKAIHFDPDVYPEPDVCDLFRFSKLRAQDGGNNKYGFATVDSHYLPFGAGRHACAGRQFASLELRIMLGHILLEYDISLPPGTTARPKNIIFNGAIIPDPKAPLMFTPRSKKK